MPVLFLRLGLRLRLRGLNLILGRRLGSFRLRFIVRLVR